LCRQVVRYEKRQRLQQESHFFGCRLYVWMSTVLEVGAVSHADKSLQQMPKIRFEQWCSCL